MHHVCIKIYMNCYMYISLNYTMATCIHIREKTSSFITCRSPDLYSSTTAVVKTPWQWKNFKGMEESHKIYIIFKLCEIKPGLFCMEKKVFIF